MNHAYKQPTGSLKISHEVLATIAKVAALEVDGVAGLAKPASSVKRAFSRGLGKPPIRIEWSDDFVKLGVAVDLAFGAPVADVCAAIQANVKDNIQTMTGMAVSKVNVTVEGIVFPDDRQIAPPNTP